MATPATTQRVIPHQATGKNRFLAAVIYGLSRALSATWRIRFEGEAQFIKDQKGPFIFAIWHNRLALSMPIWTQFVRRFRKEQGLVAFISASRDGGMLAEVLRRYEVHAVRGSSSRRGRQALLEATTWVENGYHVAVTPDGPRGPCYVVQEGVLALAQVTGRPIIPVSCTIRPKIKLGSWDRFQVPLPFAACVVHFAKPLALPREASDEERASLRQELHARLQEMTRD